MAYFNTKTYEIWDSVIKEFRDDMVEVDEVIAPVIQRLNQKGYVTEYCCSGHPFKSIWEGKMSKEEFLRTEQNEGKVFHSFEVDKNTAGIGLLANKNNLYISFIKSYGFGTSIKLPDGFIYDEDETECDVIRFYYNNIEGYPLQHERLEVCEKLLNWANELPIVA